ncbi:DUF2441 domain-containing protein [Virgibacillus salexigens]|uniref:DUF2441 domain-containing protein n=1 Tax=Virgibacillus salexigens TaxID=61016 RepID=UPI003081BE66
MSYFHATNKKMINGELIIPKYGRAISHQQNLNNAHLRAQYNKEMIFEEVRKESYSAMPSRLDSIYFVEGLENARKYAIEKGYKYIYSVTFLTSCRILTADMSWLDISNKQLKKDDIVEIAHNYFSGKNSENCFWEYLSNGKVSVHEKFELQESE